MEQPATSGGSLGGPTERPPAMRLPFHLLPLVLLGWLAVLPASEPSVVDYHLTIAETRISPAGTPVRALTINGGVPGPVLRFTEGDTARITVTNALKEEETSIHWHGVLLPNAQDGVPHLTTPPIKPGTSFTFEFRLKHTGTYWYHSHTGLQEQRGIYGGIVVAPKQAPPERDEVLILSDWTREDPDEVMRTLMRGSDWYAIRKGTAQSIVGAIRSGHFRDYLNRERSRLPPMDVSDVAYDAFLINGAQRSRLAAKPGEIIRLRVVNAGASTYFYLQSSVGPLTIIANDGMDVVPIQQKRLLIGMGETYDLRFTVPADGAWELRATAQDGSGHASLLIGDGPEHAAETIPLVSGYSMDQALAAVLDQLDETGGLSDAEAISQEKDRPLPPYKRLRSPIETSLPADAPTRTLRLHLTGDMMRYIWSINGRTLTEDTVIPITRGEVLRLELINDTMMHHPMHLHGHFFRLLMPDGPDQRFAPLKHTVDVPPMSRRTVEFLADEHQDWLFHCHLLYHHMAGMGRVFSYDDQGAAHRPALEPIEPMRVLADGTVQSQMSTGRAMLMGARNSFSLMWRAGWGEPDFEFRDDIEYEADLVYERYFNPRWMAFAGLRATNMMHERGHLAETGAAVDLGDEAEGRLIAGASYRLPYNIDSMLSIESSGDLRAGLGKLFQVTDRLGVSGRVEYDTNVEWMWSVGASYTLAKRFSLVASYDSDYGAGAGVGFRF